MDRKDPFIREERMGVREDAENHDNEYSLHVVKTQGPPLTHVTLRTRPEVVVFGAEQEFSAPMYVSAGKHILVTAQPGATTVSLAKFEVGRPDQRKEVSMKVADVIRAADELGAKYPDIVQMLADASKQKNLPTSLGMDKLPEAGRAYYRPKADGSSSRGSPPVRVGRENFTPNIFPEVDDPEEAARRKQEAGREPRSGEGPMASVPSEPPPTLADLEASAAKKDGRTKKSDEKKSKSSWSWFNRNK
jgi:hypothetical protein